MAKKGKGKKTPKGEGGGMHEHDYSIFRNGGFISLEEVSLEETNKLLKSLDKPLYDVGSGDGGSSAVVETELMALDDFPMEEDGDANTMMVANSDSSVGMAVDLDEGEKTEIPDAASLETNEPPHQASISPSKNAKLPPKWSKYASVIPSALHQPLANLNFEQPTEIQDLILTQLSQQQGLLENRRDADKGKSKGKKNANRKSDILACAPTGSGKTLAFLLPILFDLIDECLLGDNKVVINDDGGDQESRGSAAREAAKPKALIIVPTRELAIQIKQQLDALQLSTINSCCIVGGLSEAKQVRLLGYNPQIIIGTPGRLASLLVGQGVELDLVDYLVLDEADRLLEKGHFTDLKAIFQRLSTSQQQEQRGQATASTKRSPYQTFLFSATLFTENIQKAFKKHLKFNHSPPLHLNLNKANPATLKHLRIECVSEDKIAILYWLLCTELGLFVKNDRDSEMGEKRFLVFVNSISLLRTLTSTLKLLFECTPYNRQAAGGDQEVKDGTDKSQAAPLIIPLHSQLTQKSRMNNLEKFAKRGGVMITSDVASRGLDIPNVDGCIHFHLPSASKTYKHRAGRSARGVGVDGKSIALIAPHEQKLVNGYKQELLSYEQQERKQATPAHNPYIKRAATLAHSLAISQDRQQKQSKQRRWEEEAAAILEIDIAPFNHTGTHSTVGRGGDVDGAFDDDGSARMQSKLDHAQTQANRQQIRQALYTAHVAPQANNLQ